MSKRAWLWLAALCALPALAQTQTPWQRIAQPVAGAPQAIGSYANGCIIGAQALPLASENYQVMRSDQRRYFGHPTLLAFVARLGAEARTQRLGTLLIGDMAMPAGGRFNGGHASHQSGLDVDIWLQPVALDAAGRRADQAGGAGSPGGAYFCQPGDQASAVRDGRRRSRLAA